MIQAILKDEEQCFKEAMLRIFGERAQEFPQHTLALLKNLWMDGVHHGHNLRLTEEIVLAIRTGKFDYTTGTFELNTDTDTDTHE
jgi:hypothetical protein